MKYRGAEVLWRRFVLARNRAGLATARLIGFRGLLFLAIELRFWTAMFARTKVGGGEPYLTIPRRHNDFSGKKT
jgi:hypothetical protein